MFQSFNWIDVVVIFVLVFYAIEGYTVGGIVAFFDFLKFVVSFLLSLKVYSFVGAFLSHFFSIPPGISNAIGFFVSAFVIEILLQIILGKPIAIFIRKSILRRPEYQKINSILGFLPGTLSGLVLVMFLLTVIVSLPISPFLKDSISNAKIGGLLVARSQILEKQFSDIFGGAANETLNFLTVEPESNSMVQLHFTYDKGTPDLESENGMLQMVNQERTSRGLNALTMDSKLQAVARVHAQDMLQRGYFSHYTPEGKSPFDRMDEAGIVYTSAGENLAFSPNLQLAMQGLMQSPGHRANILSKDFGKVGIGVINAGIYGEMFVQEFTN